MKRLLFVLLLVLSIGIMIAVESDPSATVGYFKKSVASGAWTTMSLPFNYDSLDPNAIFGDETLGQAQFADGDQIMNVFSGDSWTFFTGYGFYPSNEEVPYLELGKGYWVNRFSGNPGLDYYIMGKVDTQPVTVVALPNGWNVFSLNESRPVDPYLELTLTEMPLVVENDQIMDVYTGDNWTWFNEYGWYPSNEAYPNLLPTEAYWYYTSTAGYSWTYPNRGRADLNPVRSKQK